MLEKNVRKISFFLKHEEIIPAPPFNNSDDDGDEDAGLQAPNASSSVFESSK